MANDDEAIEQFFDRYRAALLARDEAAVAALYGAPSLILFPGQAIAVGEPAQTERFFASAWDQYDGVEAVDAHLRVIARAPGSAWVDVTWRHDGEPRERFCYQLVDAEAGLRIAVLTPMAPEAATGP